MTYRPDIDGLRAIAVLAVILYHAEIFPFSGGYVGVDVFFVISGFLITGIILPKLNDEKFSIAHFYERRLRRIFPALFAMLFSCAILTYWILWPGDRVAFGESLVATTLFVSNHYFLSNTGYFSGLAESAPLLHTWSLAVEEQFYILFPFYLLAVRRFLRARYVLCTAVVTFASFGAGAWLIGVDPDASFYLSAVRGWEIGIGALLAMMPRRLNVTAVIRNVTGIIGAGLIVFAIFRFSNETVFPGANALIPCSGAVLIIWSGMSGPHIVGRALQLKPLVGIGLISYPLYLWHWPLLVFAKYGSASVPESLRVTLVLAVTFGLSIISYRYIEKPVRSSASVLQRRDVFLRAALLVCFSLAAGFVAIEAKKLPWQQYDAQVRNILTVDEDHEPSEWPCWNQTVYDLNAKDHCLLGDLNKHDSTFVLWGDSHAGAIARAVSEIATVHGRKGRLATSYGCPPMLGIVKPKRAQPLDCQNFNDYLLNFVIDDPQITDVILSARWGLYTSGKDMIIDAGSGGVSEPESREAFVRAFRKTIEELRIRGKRLWILGPVPEVGVHLPAALFKLREFSQIQEVGPKLDAHLNRERLIYAELEKVAGLPDVGILYPHRVLCAPDNYCQVMRDGKLLYFDDHHLTWSGSDLLAPLIEQIFQVP